MKIDELIRTKKHEEKEEISDSEQDIDLIEDEEQKQQAIENKMTKRIAKQLGVGIEEAKTIRRLTLSKKITSKKIDQESEDEELNMNKDVAKAAKGMKDQVKLGLKKMFAKKLSTMKISIVENDEGEKEAVQVMKHKIGKGIVRKLSKQSTFRLDKLISVPG